MALARVALARMALACVALARMVVHLDGASTIIKKKKKPKFWLHLVLGTFFLGLSSWLDTCESFFLVVLFFFCAIWDLPGFFRMH